MSFKPSGGQRLNGLSEAARDTYISVMTYRPIRIVALAAAVVVLCGFLGPCSHHGPVAQAPSIATSI